MSFIRIEHLRKEFPEATPLTDVCAEIERGDVIAVIGPSGTGKSTLLRCLNQLVEPTSGTVTVDNEVITHPDCDIRKVRQKMGMVFQSFNLFQNRTVLENVISAPVDLLEMPRGQAVREGMELLERVGLSDKADRFPDELSGGQQQRAAIVRALMMKPEILLFDEPTSALDPSMTAEVLAVIKDLAGEGMTMLIVTHEMKFAREAANRVFYMDEGVIYEEGSPEQIFGHPQREKTRQFVRQLKTLSIEIGESGADYADVVREFERFGRESMVTEAELRRILLVFEELVMQSIFTHIRETGNGFPIRVAAEHSGEDGTTAMTVTFGGDAFDPLTQGDGISAAIVRRMTSEIRCRYDGENRISAVIRRD